MAVLLEGHGNVVGEFKVMFTYTCLSVCLSVCVPKDEASIARSICNGDNLTH